jgi:hypothetical protein
MSSSNRVRLAFIAESTYGVTPGAGNFKTARFTSEALSASPNTVESAQIRTDRLSSGQVVVGLEVGGEMNFELAKESALEEFMLSAMHQSAWSTLATVSIDMTLAVSARTLTRASGSFITDGLVKGDFITLAGFSNSTNNVPVMITAITALVLTCAIPDGMVNETGSGTSYTRADKISVGTTKKSFSIEKAFLDLTTKAINYKGMICSEMSLTFSYGELATGSFSFSGNYQAFADAANEFLTDGRTIDASATTQTFNGSIDMPFLASDAIGTFGASEFALQSVGISLNNNLTSQTVIGNSAPIDYSSGTARIEVSLSAYLNDDAWAVLPKKLSQESFALGFMVKNTGGWYGFYLPAVQVSFDDPASPGQDQDILLEMEGQAKVGSSGESSMTIYRSV